MEGVAVFAAAFAALYTAHSVGDHWVQTDHQARAKGGAGWAGRWSCAKHVATLQATKLVVLAGVFVPLGLALDPVWVAVALVVDGASHYLADRRAPLLAMVRALDPVTAKARFAALGLPREGRDDNPSLGTGLYALDQAWHHAWCLVAAVLIAVGGAA